MHSKIVGRLLRVASNLQTTADTRMSFDEFISDVYDANDNLANTIKSSEDVRRLLDRSGYIDIAGKMSEVTSGIRDLSAVMDKLLKMHSQGMLSYGPRHP